MAYELVMPRLGWTMEEGTLVEWLKRDGDTVQVGDLVFSVESDKAINEVEALEAGILRIPPDSPPPGSVLPIGVLLAYIVKPGEPAPFEQIGQAATRPVATSVVVTAARSHPDTTPTRTATTQRSQPAISPRARRLAVSLGVPWETLAGSGRTGRIVERDVQAAVRLGAPSDTQPRATPLARKVAHDLDVKLEQVAGTLPGNRISRADVEAASTAGVTIPAVPQAADDVLVPMSSVRRLIAERMAAGVHTTAPVTLTLEVDATEMVRMRKQIAADAGSADRPVPSYTDLLVKLCAVALTEHPHVNARLHDDGILHIRAVHIGIAVDTDRGLLVPVIRDAQHKSLRIIAADSNDLIARARSGQLRPDELRGGTFTITNLGMFGVDAFTPILNLPECAILGVGRIVPKQVVLDADAERVGIRHMMFLSLTFDHRLIDGAQAARFLSRIRQFIEQPYLWLS